MGDALSIGVGLLLLGMRGAITFLWWRRRRSPTYLVVRAVPTTLIGLALLVAPASTGIGGILLLLALPASFAVGPYVRRYNAGLRDRADAARPELDARIGALVAVLRAAGSTSEAEHIEDVVRRSSRSDQVVERLRAVLRATDLDDARVREQVDALDTWAEGVLRPSR